MTVVRIAATIGGMARDDASLPGSQPEMILGPTPATDQTVEDRVTTGVAARLVDGLVTALRRLRPPPVPRASPGSLPPLRGWTEGRGRHDIVVFVYRGVSSAEVELLAGAIADELAGRVVFTSPEPGPVVGIEPTRMIETVPLDDAPEPFVLVVPGGLAWRREAERTATTEWLGGAAESARGVIGVSTGTLLLAAAGLVEGGEAAGHWLAGDLMEELGVRKSVDRVVHHRLLATASGTSAGVDAARELARAVRFSPWAAVDGGR